jgi:hypothetical protein
MRELKYFKQNLLENIRIIYMLHTLEEMIKENEPMLIMNDMDMKTLDKKRRQLIYV